MSMRFSAIVLVLKVVPSSFRLVGSFFAGIAIRIADGHKKIRVIAFVFVEMPEARM